MVNDLELAGARRTASVDVVLPLSRYLDVKKPPANGSGLFEALAQALRENSVHRVDVPHAFPAGGVGRLRRCGIRAVPMPDPFFPARARKNAGELRAIGAALRATETGLATAILTLAASRVGRDGYLYLGNERLTSETVREKADRAMFAAGTAPHRTIVAGGIQGADPHCQGSGPLRAHRPIVLDFFPRHRATGYYGDLTRTVVKGKADAATRRAFDAVLEAQRLAFKLIRHGAEASAVHAKVSRFFEAAGYPSRALERGREGFFHGTGHGIGLDLHEMPVLGRRRERLEAGQVVTVEPGLYYRDLGGIRIEDVVRVTREGCQKLSRFPVFLEVP
jgi:Xaa-Pro aminopeptidase